MKLSDEILNWYYVGDEIPARKWADRIAELEARIKFLDEGQVHLNEIIELRDEQLATAQAENERLRDA